MLRLAGRDDARHGWEVGRGQVMSITLHEQDLPDDVSLGPVVALDTEAMGLDVRRDRLCLVQLSGGDGTCHLVRFRGRDYHAPNLCRLLTDPKTLKLFHFARFDLAMLRHHLGVSCGPVYCTKIASKLARTYTDRHGLKDLCKDLLGIDLAKHVQSSDWGAPELSEAQMSYAAHDVLHLHRLREQLDAILQREGRTALAAACFAFLPRRVELDLEGWAAIDIFAH
jgi:ribonuclease D